MSSLVEHLLKLHSTFASDYHKPCLLRVQFNVGGTKADIHLILDLLSPKERF
jgi:hypothetical protein